MYSKIKNFNWPSKSKPEDLLGNRCALAHFNGCDKSLLMIVRGGLGDRICTEPTLRYAVETFDGYDIYLMTSHPELYSHLPFKTILPNNAPIDLKKYLPIKTYPKSDVGIVTHDHFITHNINHCVDFHTIAAFRMTLPVCRKQPQVHAAMSLAGKRTGLDKIASDKKSVLIHLGISWENRTFSSEFWNKIISTCIRSGLRPVLIGQNCVPVSFDRDRSIDLRDQLELRDFIYLCKSSPMIITNDSSPLHIAACGNAKIAFLSTCRMPDWITHWRKNKYNEIQWSYNMKNFTVNNPWEIYLRGPLIRYDGAELDKWPKGITSDDFTPNPKDIIDWMMSIDSSHELRPMWNKVINSFRSTRNKQEASLC